MNTPNNSSFQKSISSSQTMTSRNSEPRLNTMTSPSVHSHSLGSPTSPHHQVSPNNPIQSNISSQNILSSTTQNTNYVNTNSTYYDPMTSHISGEAIKTGVPSHTPMEIAIFDLYKEMQQMLTKMGTLMDTYMNDPTRNV